MINQTALNKRNISRSMREAGDARVHRAPVKPSDGMSLAFCTSQTIHGIFLLLFAVVVCPVTVVISLRRVAGLLPGPNFTQGGLLKAH
jgi:hypothetical protein